MDITHLLKTIQKLKAGVATLYEHFVKHGHDSEVIIDRTKAIFYSNMTIYSDSEEE